MSNIRRVRNQRTNEIVLSRAKWCASFWCQLRGLQFVRDLPEEAGLIFVGKSENKVESSIHMLFMFMEIAVIWLDSSGKVVDKQLAKPWRLAYVPKEPARYFIEARPSLLNRVEIGDTLIFTEDVV